MTLHHVMSFHFRDTMIYYQNGSSQHNLSHEDLKKVSSKH